MKIQYVSEYIKLSDEGLVSKLECPMDQGPLFPNMTIEEDIYMYCLSCSYRKDLGLDSEYYANIVKEVDNVRNKHQ